MIRLALAIVAVALLVGCAESRKPTDPGTFAKTDDVPPGPGLLTGKDGAFIWRP